jgi:hypothetical protein
MMTLGQLLEQQRLDDALVSMLEVRVPLVVGDLDFQARTWKGLPIHPKEVGQFEDIANTLSDDEKVIIKWSALFLNYGRTYEIRRLLSLQHPVQFGNSSPADAVLDSNDAPHGDSSIDEWSDNTNTKSEVQR